jgi:hypothetical protein
MNKKRSATSPLQPARDDYDLIGGLIKVDRPTHFIRDNGLTIVLLIISIAMITCMLFAGWNVLNNQHAEHGLGQVSLTSYALSGHFLSALFENWESEFLQMSAYVMLTAILFQRGSAESKDPDGAAAPDQDAAHERDNIDVPAPPRAGRLAHVLYSYSLGIVLSLLFLLSFSFHLGFSAEDANAEAAMHGQPAITLAGHFSNAQFWFESLQNWQSEFLSTAVLVVLSIFLRFKGSPESKPVAAPHSRTGD